MIRLFPFLAAAIFPGRNFEPATAPMHIDGHIYGHENNLRQGRSAVLPEKFTNAYQGAIGGYVDFLCPTNSTIEPFAQCNSDCIHNHGSDGGQCGDVKKGDYNCYCGKRVNERKEESLHCVKRSSAYNRVCAVDCRCNHGAFGGVCNWSEKACVCIGAGQNKKNKGCSYKEWHSFAQFVHKEIGHSGYGPLDPIYHKYLEN